jgi:hypothetical protein
MLLPLPLTAAAARCASARAKVSSAQGSRHLCWIQGRPRPVLWQAVTTAAARPLPCWLEGAAVSQLHRLPLRCWLDQHLLLVVMLKRLLILLGRLPCDGEAKV